MEKPQAPMTRPRMPQTLVWGVAQLSEYRVIRGGHCWTTLVQSKAGKLIISFECVFGRSGEVDEGDMEISF